MKTVVSRAGLILRLGIGAMTLLLTQQVMAAGTNAGDTVSNQATVAYSVGTTPQTPIESDPNGNSTPGAGGTTDFLVDRRVDFTVTADLDTQVVAPGDGALTFDFDLAHTGNSAMDYLVTIAQLNPPGNVNGQDDTGADVPSLVLVTTYVDNLAEDGSTTISVTGNADLTLVNGDIANFEITVTAYDPAGDETTPVPLVDTSGVPDDEGVVDNVFADAGNDGVEVAGDGIEVQSAELVITKSSVVISDPVNGISANAKAIPGAVIEYTITIDNTGGAVAAAGISITDIINAPAVFRNASNPPPLDNEPYTGGTANVEFGPILAPTGSCLADALDANNDGCTWDGTTLTIAGTVLGGPPTAISVANGASLDVRFRVTIP